MLVSPKLCRKHVLFWTGGSLEQLNIDPIFCHFKTTPRGSTRPYNPKLFKTSVSLFNEACLSQRFSINRLSDISTKELYLSYTETMPPPKVELKYIDRDWPLIWKRVNSGVLQPSARNILFLIVHEKLATRERGHRILGHIYESPLCQSCFREPETIMHKIALCKHVKEAWDSLRELMESIDQLVLFESDHSLLNLCFTRLLEEDTILWLLGEYVCFINTEVIINSRIATRQNLFGHLEARRQSCQTLRIPPISRIPGILSLSLFDIYFSPPYEL